MDQKVDQTMDIENQEEKKLSPPVKKSKSWKVPQQFKINPSREAGFDINDCMEGFKTKPEEGYEKDTDYYFDSYAHFNIHEEMLKDKVNHSWITIVK